MKTKILALCLLFCLAAGACSAETKKTTVYVASLDGVVGVPMEEHVENVFGAIEGESDAVLIFRMDTPGGLVDSMSRIMALISGSKIPVVVWVGPSGARAASAGAFIVQAAHVAAMAPETNIGAAHPVTGSGGDIADSEMDRKVLNDLTAKMRSFAAERGRNAEVAESMIRDSVSLTAREAFDQYVIDFIAADIEELIAKLDGRRVNVGGAEKILSLGNYETVEVGMNFRLRALEVFSRPDIAYLALMAGIILLIIEFKAPGGFVLGAAGGALLLIAAYGLRVLPVNFAGVALLVGGIIAIIADLAAGGMGLIAAVGIAAMLMGGLIMFRAPGGELLRVSAGFVFGVTFAIGVAFFVILRKVYSVMRRKPSSGIEGLIGERAKILARENGASATETPAMVSLHGEYWRAVNDAGDSPLEPGAEVEVVGVDAMTLRVRALAPAKNDPADTAAFRE
jgi:membrane-bound serine protease (ClpP class)